MDSRNLKEWFLEHKRDLPWREDITPYKVWISEIMLQQTQVSVVIPYFLRWMESFPNIESLAEAPLENVIKLWEGLGYYSRARNIHEGAQYIVKNFGGKIPSNEEDLLKIKGIGSYTVGAIRNFAFHERAHAIDGNVIRVICRLYGIEEDVGKSSTLKVIKANLENFLPYDEPWIISEALIELGAKICQKKPKCLDCPLKLQCHAFKKMLWDKIPFKSKKTVYTKLNRKVYIFFSKDQKILLKKGEKGKIMQDLYEFPYDEMDETKESIIDSLKIPCHFLKSLDKESHSFTQYRVNLYPSIYHVSSSHKIDSFEWVDLEEIQKLSFSSGHRRILFNFMKEAL